MKDYKKILEGVVNIINTTEKSDIGFANICTYIGENCPELKESKDERIRKSILNYLTKMWGNSKDDVYGVNVEDVIAWLERQAKRNPADKAVPKFKVGQTIRQKGSDKTFIVIAVKEHYYDLTNGYVCELEHQDKWELVEQKPAESKGMNLAEEDMTPFQKKVFCIIDTTIEEEQGLKQVCDELLRLAHDEIMQKPDKIEPMFREGDWVVYENRVGLIVRMLKENYIISFDGVKEQVSFTFNDRIAKWTIQDAKYGDILHSTVFHNDCIFIFNGLDNWKFDEPNGDRAVATGYCCLSVSADNMEFGMQGPDCVEVNTVKPATKIQRDLLFRKIKEAGYEWDAEKKKLKKIEHKPTWSEEDESNFQMLIDVIKGNKHHATDYEHMKYYKLLSWFKSLKERYFGN